MLTQLHISNYAIISQVDIYPDKGLNIITGETGAGKSILMGALGLILGDRADLKVLMQADQKCVVEGTFSIKGYKLKSFFEQEGLDYDDTCVVRREITPTGKSRAFINDTPVNLVQLRELGSQLIEIVSQHETLELNEEAFQLSVVDEIAGTNDLLNDFRKKFSEYKATEKLLAELTERERKARQDEDYFRFQLNELSEANIQANEQEELEATLDVLSNAGAIQEAALAAYRMIDGDEAALVDRLREVKSVAAQGAKHHAKLEELIKRLEPVMIELKDIAADLEGIAEGTQADPAELQRVEERLQVLVALHKKHRVASNAELLALRDKLELDLKAIGSLQDDIVKTETLLSKQKAALVADAAALSAKRGKAIPAIEKKINELLKQVQMPDARIRIDNETAPAEAFNANGIDRIRLLFAANKGSSFLPISKVASGGELSRLMLCIKSLISDKVALPGIVFDEIDTGISGEAALKVSQVMKKHAKNHQVLAITHLPQIAGKADAHFYVYKSTDEKTTYTHIRKLNDSERVEEIARMLHGENPSAKVLEAAKELIAG